MIKKIFLFFSIFILISSCQDVEMYEKDKFGSLTLSFIQPSEELISSLENNRTSSQFADVDQVRITLSGQAPTVVNIVNGSASYSKSGLSVGTISIAVDLLGGGVNKYTQTKSVTIVANQTATASFNAFTVTNQSISFDSNLEATYDIGDEISLSWTNTHSEQAVDIERWDFIGSSWVKTSTLASDWIGDSGVWTTQGESSGESVKVRIQSTISNSFADSATFQLLGEQDNTFFIEYIHPNGQPTFFNDVMTLNDGNFVASGRYGSPSDRHALLVKFDVNDGSVLATRTLSSQSEFREMTLGPNGEVLVTGYNIGSNTEVVLGAYNHDLSQIALVSHANPSGESRGAYSIDTYTYNGVDYILTAGEFETGGTTYPGLFMFDINYNYLNTWYYNDAEGKFLTVNVYNGTDIWLVGSDQDIDGTSQQGKNAAELTIFNNMDTANVNVVRGRAAWGNRSTVNIEGTVPTVLSVDGDPEGDFYYAGGQYYDTNGASGATTDYRWQYYDFVLDSENGNEAVFVGNMFGVDADGNGVLDSADGLLAEIAIKRNNTTFAKQSQYISRISSKSEASWAKFNAIDKIDSGYVVAGSNLITTFSTNYSSTKGLIAVVNIDGELRTVDDRSLLGRNIGMNDVSNVQTISSVKSNKVLPR